MAAAVPYQAAHGYERDYCPGLRTLTVMSIATGSIAAFIGGGGLGEAIFRGITMYNMEMTFAGALLLVLLALACDYGLGFLEKLIKKKWRMNE